MKKIKKADLKRAKQFVSLFGFIDCLAAFNADVMNLKEVTTIYTRH